MDLLSIKDKLNQEGLKATPQRLAVLEAVYSSDNHPTAEKIIERIRENHPTIAIGTVYNVLDTMVEHGLIKKVKTEDDVMRYDGITEKHHHLYCRTCDFIEDYHDEELDQLLQEYFKNKQLDGFKVEEIVLQIRGISDKC